MDGLLQCFQFLGCLEIQDGSHCRTNLTCVLPCGKYILKLFLSDTTEPFDSKFGCIVPLMFDFHCGWKYKIDPPTLQGFTFSIEPHGHINK